MRRILILALLVLATPLFAAGETVELSARADLLYEAGEWEEALALYRKVVQEGALAGEQRAKAQYNLALALLASGDPSSALEQLDPALLGSSPSPLLASRWHRSRALACWRAALDLEERATVEPKEALSFCKAGLNRSSEGWQALQLAANFEEGEEEELLQLRLGLKEVACRLRALSSQLEIAALSPQELARFLLGEVEKGISALETVALEKRGTPPRLAQMAMGVKRLLPAWEALSKLSQDAEFELGAEGGRELTLYSIEALEGGHLWEGRALQAQSAIVLRLLLALAQEGDPLLPLLQERVVLSNRIEKERGSEELSEALSQEFDQLCLVAEGVAEQIAMAVPDPIAADLITALKERLVGEEGSSPLYDLLLYQQLGEAEEQTLLTLYREGCRRNGTQIGDRLRAIEERFIARANHETESDWQPVLDHLASARSGCTSGNWNQLTAGVEGALRSWSPASWLTVKLEAAREAAQKGVTSQLVADHYPMVEVAQGHCAQAVIDPLERSFRAVQQGMVQLSQDHPLCSEACMKEVRFSLEKAHTSLTAEKEELTLQHAVQEQKHAMALVEATEKAAQSESIFQPILSMDESAQQSVLDLAYKLHPDSFEEKERASFLQGVVEAEAARRALSVSRPDWGKAMGHQRRAIELWESSSGENQDQKSNPDSGSQGESSPSSSEEKEELSQSESSPQQVYEWLEQMEREDRQSQPTRLKVKQGARPW